MIANPQTMSNVKTVDSKMKEISRLFIFAALFLVIFAGGFLFSAPEAQAAAGLRRKLKKLARGLTRSAAELLIEVIPTVNHKNDRIVANDFVGNPIGYAARLESVNKKPAQGAVERFAGAGVALQIGNAIFHFFLSGVRKPLKIFFGGRGEKDFHHALASGENILGGSQLAGPEEFPRRAGSPLHFLDYCGMPKDIFTQEFPNFLNFPFNFLNPVFGRGSHISQY